MTQPMGGGAPAVKTSAQALWSLILGIAGIVLCCEIVSPVAWYLGRAEIKAVDAGLSAQQNRGLALAGMILGIIGTVLLILSLIWIFLFGGMAVIGGMQQGWQ